MDEEEALPEGEEDEIAEEPEMEDEGGEAAEEDDMEEVAIEEEEPEELRDEREAAAKQAASPKKARKQKPRMWQQWDGGKWVVRMRQLLRTAEEADEFNQELSSHIEEHKERGKILVFEDFDISQNPIPFEQLESLFGLLSDSAVQVERLRSFGMPTLDDAAAILLSSWLQQVTSETIPFELHLSDCALTAVGFKAVMEALSENAVFPGPDPKNASRGQLPLYLRLEGNYIEEAAMQESVEEGLAVTMTKSGGLGHSDTAKCRILLSKGQGGSFAQKEGEPPAPEDAPAPKRVSDHGKGSSSKGAKGAKGGKGKGGKNGKSGKSDGKSGKSGNSQSWKDGGSKDKKSWSKDSWSKDSQSKDSWSKDSWSKDSRSKDSWSKDSWSKDSWSKDSRSKDSRSKDSRSKDSWSKDSWSKDWKDDRRPIGASGASERSGGKGKSKAAPWQALPAPQAAPTSEAERERKWSNAGSASGKSTGSRPFTAFTAAGPETRSQKRPAEGKGYQAPPEKKARIETNGKASGGKDGKGKEKGEGKGKGKEKGEGKGKGKEKGETKSSSKGKANGSGKSKGESKGSSSKGSGKSKGESKGKSSSKEAKLPTDWEKHWSDQYKLHYYWNSKTGDSSWERPTM